MATEEGIVIKLEADHAWVKSKKSASCEGCASRKSCNVMGGGNDMEVEAINTAGAAVGDRVVMSFETSSLLKATFLLYVFPIICMFLGAVVGQEIAPAVNLGKSAASAVAGFLFFLVSMLFVRVKANKMGSESRYQPKIIRIKKAASPKMS
ncbi:MAG: SoxR reducing system RseC family protein [Desulfobacterales bacterium]